MRSGVSGSIRGQMTEAVGDTPLTRFLATQTLTQLRELKSEYRSEIDGLQTRVAALESELPLIEQAIHEKTGTRKRGKRTLPPRVPSSNGGPEPGSLRLAILLLMGQPPKRPWTTQDLYDALRRQGLAPQGGKPKNTILNRLLELEKAGDVERVSRGTYVHANGGTASQRMGRNPLSMGSATQEAGSKGV
jgi:hypothetical protein